MNQRLVTAAIVLISFAATYGLASRHTALWRVATDESRPAPAIAPQVPAAAAAPVAVTATPAAPAAEHVDPAPANEPEAGVAPQPRAENTDAFLADRDRAAAHSARSH